MTVLTPDDLARLRAACKQATPGPWTDRFDQGVTGPTAAALTCLPTEFNRDNGHVQRPNQQLGDGVYAEWIARTARVKDAEFIALAREWLPKLLAQHDAQAETITRLTEELTEARVELQNIDSLMARRPALDEPTRYDNIAKAIRVAGQSDSALRKLEHRAGQAEAALATAREELARWRAGVTNLESLYETDRVAQATARQIEKIFDELLHGDERTTYCDPPQRDWKPTRAEIAEKLTDDVLREIGGTMALTLGYANDNGFCGCNGCWRYRADARNVALDALAPFCREGTEPETTT